MRLALLAAIAACFALPAQSSTMLARQGSDWVRVTDKPCTDQRVLSHLAPGAESRFMAASSIIGGAPFAACWTLSGNMALIIFDDGDKGMIPLSAFKEDLGV
jgi:hypothetical protein